MALVTLAQAVLHLRLSVTLGSNPVDPQETDLTLKLAHAEAIVLDYCNTTATWRTVTATWVDDATTPDVVQAAVLLQLGELWRFRGDDVDGSGPSRTDGEDLAPRVRDLLRRHRDPVVA